MKKKFFSGGLWAEGMRQNRVFGFIMLAVIMVLQLYAPITDAFAETITEHSYANVASRSWVTLVNMNDILSSIWLVPYVLAPVSVLILFSVFNKRGSADFYHSLPYTRSCVFISYGAAVLTWTFGVMLITGGFGIAVRLAMPKVYAVSFANFGDIVFSMFSATILSAASVMLASSVTGTLLSNVTLSGLIIFLPRMLIYVVAQMMTNRIPFVLGAQGIPLLAPKYNVLVYSLIAILSGSPEDCTVNNLNCDLYTLVLALIYVVMAAVLFCMRKSEIATLSAPGKKTQALIRIALTLAISVFGTWVLAENDSNSIGIAIIIYIIAVVVYFAYELLSTMKWKNLVRAIPCLGIVLLLNLAVYGMTVGYGKIAVQYTPAPSEISGVRISDPVKKSYTSSGTMLQDDDYAELMTSDIEFDDPQLAEIVSNALRDNVETYENGYYDERYTGLMYEAKTTKSFEPGLLYDESTSTYKRLTVAIRKGCITTYRYIYFSEADMKEIAKILNKNEAYRNAFLNIPEEVYGTVYGTFNISDDGYTEVMSCFREEVRRIGFEKWYAALKAEEYRGNFYSHLSFTDKKTGYMISLPLSPETTPDTLSLAMQISERENPEQYEECLNFFANGQYENAALSVDMYVWKYDDNGSGSESTWVLNGNVDDSYDWQFQSKSERLKIVAELARALKDRENCSYSNGFIRLDVFIQCIDQGEDYYGKQYDLYLPLPDGYDPSLIDGYEVVGIGY